MSNRGRLTLIGLSVMALGLTLFFWPSGSTHSVMSGAVSQRASGSSPDRFSSEEVPGLYADPDLLGRLPGLDDYETLSSVPFPPHPKPS